MVDVKFFSFLLELYAPKYNSKTLISVVALTVITTLYHKINSFCCLYAIITLLKP